MVGTITGKLATQGMWGAVNATASPNDGAMLVYGSEFDCLSFSSDDSLLLGINTQEGKEIFVWEVDSGKVRLKLKGGGGAVKVARFVPQSNVIASTSGDCSIVLWNRISGLELARLYSFGPEDWLVVSPDGHFDATKGAMKMIYGRDNNDIIESDKLKERLHIPGLLQQVILPLLLSPGE